MKTNRFFWIDLEMTGLNEKVHQILEVAVVITDLNFQPIEEFHRVVFQPPEVLSLMDEWCTQTHTASGLLERVPSGRPLQEVEIELIQLIQRHFAPEVRVVLAGNSVHNDKRFIDHSMPMLASRLHYRVIDVSSFKEIFREKYSLTFKKQNLHRAVDDIYASIHELEFYLSHVRPQERM